MWNLLGWLVINLIQMAWVGLYFLVVIFINSFFGIGLEGTIWTLLFTIFWVDMENRGRIKALEEDVDTLMTMVMKPTEDKK